MARIRSIKPEFFFDEELAELPDQTRLFFIGLWTQADREGRLEERAPKLKAQLFPYEKADAECMLGELHPKFILRYTLAGRAYIQIVNFLKHQRPHHTEPESDIPSADGLMVRLGQYPRAAVRRQIYNRDNYTCIYCGLDMRNDPRRICLDHIIPLSKEGSHDPSNLATSCKKCNALKYDKVPSDVGLPHPEGLGSTVQYEGVGTPSTGGEASVNSSIQGRGKGKGKGNEEGKEKEGIKGLDEFRVFWEAYPKKVGKKEARKAWERRDRNTDKTSLSRILEAIEKQKEHWREARFIPNPATWLNQERWDDEPPKSAAQEIWDRAQEEKRHDT